MILSEGANCAVAFAHNLEEPLLVLLLGSAVRCATRAAIEIELRELAPAPTDSAVSVNHMSYQVVAVTGTGYCR